MTKYALVATHCTTYNARCNVAREEEHLRQSESLSAAGSSRQPPNRIAVAHIVAATTDQCDSKAIHHRVLTVRPPGVATICANTLRFDALHTSDCCCCKPVVTGAAHRPTQFKYRHENMIGAARRGSATANND